MLVIKTKLNIFIMLNKFFSHFKLNQTTRLIGKRRLEKKPLVTVFNAPIEHTANFGINRKKNF